MSEPIRVRRLGRADQRALATGETHQQATTELRQAGLGAELIPAAAPQQALLEARVLAGLMAEYGRHQPGTFVYGVMRASGRTHTLALRIDPGALVRFASAVTARCEGERPALRIEPRTRSVVLHGFEGGAITLVGVFPRDWSRAIGEARMRPGPWNGGPVKNLGEHLAAHLSAVLRRIALLGHVAELTDHGGTLDYRLVPNTVGDLQLSDLCAWHQASAAPWAALEAPRILWPSPPPAPPADGPGLSAAAQAPAALCTLAGLQATTAALAAAERALAVAEQQVADGSADGPRRAYWVASYWRGEERFPDQGPFAIPGAAQMRDGLDLNALGRQSSDDEAADHEKAPAGIERGGVDIEEVFAERGWRRAVALLKWALLAATAPERPEYQWVRAEADPIYEDPAKKGTLWTASQPVAADISLQLRAWQQPGGFRYEVQPGPEGVPPWVPHMQPALASGEAPSLRAAMLLAENDVVDLHAQAARLRTRQRRLIVPAPVPAAALSLTDLLARVEDDEEVFDLYVLFNRLCILADLELKHVTGLPVYHGPARGHWILEPGAHCAGPFTVTGALSGDTLPVTHFGEGANTAEITSQAYRAHLARHRYGIDPFAEAYLAAADACTDEAVTFSERHAAGLAALRAADPAALLALDPRPAAGNASLNWALANLPQTIRQIRGFHESWLRRREGAQPS